MRNRTLEYPHPMLNEYSEDFVEGEFGIRLINQGEEGPDLQFDIEVDLTCEGLRQMIRSGDAAILVRVICTRTAYRVASEVQLEGITTINVPKDRVVGSIELQGLIVATREMASYRLEEFNKKYFTGMAFKLRKGDILADEPGLVIRLDTVLESNPAGIVLISENPSITRMKVYYATADEADPAKANYITIHIPQEEYKNYGKLRTKKHLKHGIERFLQGTVVLPAIAEGIARLRFDEMLDEEDREGYRGTVWADSIYEALSNKGIDDLAGHNESAYELANLILGNVVGDSINNLMEKLEEWSRVPIEEEI